VGFAFHRLGFGLRDLPPPKLPYARHAPIPVADPEPHDSSGVRMRRLGGRDYDHPVGQAGFGLYNLESFVVGGDRFYLDRARAQADRLVACATEHRGGWFLPYPFEFRLHGRRCERMRPPWYSGMAQGKALSLFVRLAEVTGEQHYADAAARVFATFLLPPDGGRGGDPWVVFTDDAGYLWLEEYPAATPDRTFNGHMFAAWGVWDYWRLTRDGRAAALWDGALTTVSAYFPQLRDPGWISWYCLGHERRSAKYHNVHVVQMRKLYEMSGDPVFALYAEQLAADYPWPDVRRPVEVAAGTRTAYRFDQHGEVTGEQVVTLPGPLTVPARARTRVAGREGYWYLLAGGPFQGHHLPEEPGVAVMPGEYLGHDYTPPLEVTLPAGPGTGRRFDTEGRVVGTMTHACGSDGATLAVRRFATWNGDRHALVAAGPLEGCWVPARGLTVVRDGVAAALPEGQPTSV
jgi:D-glucuronyl C5-epimerase C-terminus